MCRPGSAGASGPPVSDSPGHCSEALEDGSREDTQTQRLGRSAQATAESGRASPGCGRRRPCPGNRCVPPPTPAVRPRGSAAGPSLRWTPPRRTRPGPPGETSHRDTGVWEGHPSMTPGGFGHGCTKGTSQRPGAQHTRVPVTEPDAREPEPQTAARSQEHALSSPPGFLKGGKIYVHTWSPWPQGAFHFWPRSPRTHAATPM